MIHHDPMVFSIWHLNKNRHLLLGKRLSTALRCIKKVVVFECTLSFGRCNRGCSYVEHNIWILFNSLGFFAGELLLRVNREPYAFLNLFTIKNTGIIVNSQHTFFKKTTIFCPVHLPPTLSARQPLHPPFFGWEGGLANAKHVRQGRNPSRLMTF